MCVNDLSPSRYHSATGILLTTQFCMMGVSDLQIPPLCKRLARTSLMH